MATTSPLTYPQRRSGFTLIELLAVMLLILTVLGMGVPAMFSAERKSYVNQAMTELIQVHQACMAMQRELATRGDPGIVTLTIQNPTSAPVAMVTISPNTGVIVPQTWIARTLPISINADQFISRVDSSTGTLSWSYQKQSGFTSFANLNVLTFKALPSGGTYKVQRTLNLYPQGYSEIP